jgi:hypothetical protein
MMRTSFFLPVDSANLKSDEKVGRFFVDVIVKIENGIHSRRNRMSTFQLHQFHGRHISTGCVSPQQNLVDIERLPADVNQHRNLEPARRRVQTF